MVRSSQFPTPFYTANFSSVKGELKPQLMLPAFNYHSEYTKQCPSYLIFKHDTVNLEGRRESFRILFCARYFLSQI